MVITAINTLKQWFQTGMIPRQDQFWAIFDSFRHKSDKVPASDIEGIDNLLFNKADKEAFIAHLSNQAAHSDLFNAKVDKETGKVLSDQNFTVEEKNKLANIYQWIAANVQGAPNLGALTPSTVPSGTGSGYWFTMTAGTYPNAGGVVVEPNSLAVIVRDNLGSFSISQTPLNIDLTDYATKSYVAENGGKIKPFVDQAYPINSQVSSLGKIWYNNAATTIGEIPGTSSKWVELLSGYATTDLFFQNKTRNLYNKDFTIGRGKLGDDNNAAFDTYDFIPVSPGEKYFQSNDKNGLISDYFYFFDANKTQVSAGFVYTNPVFIPSNVAFIRIRFSAAADYSRYQLEKSEKATNFVPFATPKNTSEFMLKGDFSFDSKQDVSYNENPYFGNTNNPFSKNETVNANFYFSDKISDYSNPILNAFGVFDSIVSTGEKAASGIPNTVGIKRVQILNKIDNKFKKYIYLSTILATDDLAAVVELTAFATKVSGSNGTSTNKVSKITELGTYGGLKYSKYDFQITLQDETALYSEIVAIYGFLQPNVEAYTYKISGLGYFDSSIDSDTLSALFILSKSKILEDFSLKKAVEFNKLPATKNARTQILKNWDLYGTSIDQMGEPSSSYMRIVAEYYNCNLRNHAVGGSRITFDSTPSDFDYVYNGQISPQDRCWSATLAERQAFMTAVNRYSPRVGEADEIALCYDNSLTPNMADNDIVFIGTYGVNDPLTMPASVMAICEMRFQNGAVRYMPNKRGITAPNAVTAADMFDRRTLFGAYNYMLREIRRLKPKARIIVLGQNQFAWGQYLSDDIVAIVCDLWNIPFIRMSQEMGMSEMIVGTNGDTARRLIGDSDDPHPFTQPSRQWIADYLIKKLQPYI